MFISGQPVAEDRTQQFDCLIITASHAFNKASKQLSALQIAANLAEWLIDDDNLVFTYNDERFYTIRDDVSARMILQDNRYTVIALSVNIGRG